MILAQSNASEIDKQIFVSVIEPKKSVPTKRLGGNDLKHSADSSECAESEKSLGENQSDFAILKRLVDKFSKNHTALVHQQTLNSKYEKYKGLSKEKLIDKLLKRAQKTLKLKDKAKGLK